MDVYPSREEPLPGVTGSSWRLQSGETGAGRRVSYAPEKREVVGLLEETSSRGTCC
jgi:hypothetical protein